MRELLYVPAVHDYGELPAVVRGPIFFDHPERPLLDQIQDILWTSVYRELALLKDNFSGIRLFGEGITEDGQAVAEEERVPFSTSQKIDREIQERSFLKMRQTSVCASLHLAGAVEVATEDPILYKEAHRLIALLVRQGDTYSRMSVMLNYLLTENTGQRDEHVAGSVNGGLMDGNQDILIMGAGHKILPKLEPDIRVKFISPEVERYYRIRHDEKLYSLEETVDMLKEVNDSQVM